MKTDSKTRTDMMYMNNCVKIILGERPRGATQICRCTHASTKVLKYAPKHVSVKMQNSPPKQAFRGILSQI